MWTIEPMVEQKIGNLPYLAEWPMLCDHHQPAPLLPECHNKLNEEVPAGNVENEGFKHMINVIEPRYDLPSRVHFSEKVIPKL